MKNLLIRTLSALILAPFVIYEVIVGGYVFEAILFFAAVIMVYEWCNITKASSKKILWWLFGLFYVLFPTYVILVLSEIREPFFGFEKFPTTLLGIIIIVWLTDIGGYIFGKAVGGPKIAPKISPNKTWAGLLGGIIFSLAFFLFQNIFEPYKSLYENEQFFNRSLVGYILLPVIAQIGDFFESWVKRRFGKKDSGALIPGHGGLLDRLDGLLFVCHVIGLFIVIKIIVSHF
jgi:phosphatidate cytidylyltransferase